MSSPFVFISYCHDDKTVAVEFGRRLTALGVQHFRDEDSIDWGEDIPSKVHEALERATHLVVLISPGIERSQWVAYETGYARGRRVQVVPYLLHPQMKLPGFVSSKRYIKDQQDEAKFLRSLKRLLAKVRSKKGTHARAASPIARAVLDVVDHAYASSSESKRQRQSSGSAEQQTSQKTDDREGQLKSLRIAVNAAIDAAEIAFKSESHMSGVATGFADLDRRLGGLNKSELIVVAGRPSMGKTAFATTIAYNAARAYREQKLADGSLEVVEGAKVALFSLEMSAEQLATRVLSQMTDVPPDKIQRGDVSGDHFPRFVFATQELAALPLFIDDTPALSLSEVRNRVRRLQRAQGVDLIVIDCLQLLAPSGGGQGGTASQMSGVTLKALAREMNVPILAISQLGRVTDEASTRRPSLAELRGTGPLEQHADVVIFIHRESYYLERAEPVIRPGETEQRFQQRYEEWATRCNDLHNIAEIIIAKRRSGPVATVPLMFEPEFTRFSSLPEIARPGFPTQG